ncbi:MAG: tRNA uridine-5-carboxymethylaminomethyl(34) synthesis GTPase MnmE [Bacteroidetes bacterium HGW-Bacteroidetes-1]|jgi:tRNA modification GTPase|nr:MAG: tRNA uridine-5-carboxymethylaminomethyl(34) synthesis GTPase MnmE [Bacteroidetes bacterium HGW-Bacteroidetes-1]
MRFNFQSSDTICALSTAPGMAAIAVIRISGTGSFKLAERFFRAKSKHFSFEKAQSHHVYFGLLFEGDELVDEVLLSVFRGPHSYTGEDMVEISCHGSTYIQQQILRMLLEHGARLAEPGEFTLRAFSHGRFDLAQAEAIADLIASNSRTTHDLAMKQMRGGFSDKISQLRTQLVDFASLIELELDFAEEDVEFANREDFFKLLKNLQLEMGILIESFKTGNAIKTGIPVAIIGKPNVGKSTLLNAILNEEKAIVSEIPGTTRDVIEDTIIIDGYNFRFIDTAGLRESDDLIENMGIERTYEKINQASIILYIVDIASFKGEMAEEILEDFKSFIENENKHFILIGNKIDMMEEIPGHFREMVELETIFVSAKRKENIHLIADSLVKAVKNLTIQSDSIVSNTRHYNALKEASSALMEVEKNFRVGLPSDLIAIDIRTALHHLGSITGEIYTEEILGNIFSKFCIGK